MQKQIVAFLANNEWSKIVAGMIEVYLPNSQLQCFWMNKSDPLPSDVTDAPIDLCISFLSPRIISRDILERSKLNVNFHPGDSNYPGIGCYNFALYQNVQHYGVVCHHMETSVDTGPIIIEKTFPISKEETVDTLQFKSYCNLIQVCREFLEQYSAGANFTKNNLNWSKPAYTRADLEKLLALDPKLDTLEIARLSRATNYPGYGQLKNSRPLIKRVFENM